MTETDLNALVGQLLIQLRSTELKLVAANAKLAALKIKEIPDEPFQTDQNFDRD